VGRPPLLAGPMKENVIVVAATLPKLAVSQIFIKSERDMKVFN
jgi:hypothetical protein